MKYCIDCEHGVNKYDYYDGPPMSCKKVRTLVYKKLIDCASARGARPTQWPFHEWCGIEGNLYEGKK